MQQCNSVYLMRPENPRQALHPHQLLADVWLKNAIKMIEDVLPGERAKLVIP